MRPAWPRCSRAERFDRVVHLAAQAGVRYSLENPQAYVDSNVTGTLNVLEGCRHNGVAAPGLCLDQLGVRRQHEDAVLGAPGRRRIRCRFYAATKRANELMAHNYAALFRLPVTGLRFFTVYGPWGRPDMALFLFTKNILAGKPIDVFNHGHHKRDFTYVEDIAEGVVRALDRIATPESGLEQRRPGSGHQQRAVSRLQHRQQQPGGAVALHRDAGEVPGPEGARRTCCRCSRATCRIPTRMWRIWCATWATSRRPRWRQGVRPSSSGTGVLSGLDRWPRRERRLECADESTPA